MGLTRLTEAQITASSAVGLRLVRYSHLGEDPDPRANPDRRLDDVTEGGFAPVAIVAVRTSDTDNVVAVLCGGLLHGLVRDSEGRVQRDSSGKLVKGPLLPPEGVIEIGIGPGGWIEVDDGS